jgi:ABC-type transport system substrate-binding protein
MHNFAGKPTTVALIALSLLLALIVACGGAAPEAAPTTTDQAQPASQQAAPQQAPAQQPAGQQASGQQAAQQQQAPQQQQAAPQQTGPTKVPIATVAPTQEAPAAVVVDKPEGILTGGQKELGPFIGHPNLAGNPQIYVMSTAPITESLFTVNSDLEVVPFLAREWEVSEDSLTWTFYIEEGVQFHKGYGEMTAEDVLWSMQQFADSAKHPRASNIRGVFVSEEGHAKVIDDYTLEINTGTPWSEVPVNEMLTSPAGSATWIVSKRQTEELGAEAASGDIAATGSWELMEARTGEFWRMAAVEDHWRKTPHFAELVFREIPEESSRIAGFQTGNLDTTLIAFDSLALIEEVEGAELMRLPGGGEAAVTFYGQYYVGIGTDAQQPGYDPDLPWVSADPDLDSDEWKNAAKVRTALSIAIDRQGIVDTLLHGYGGPAVLWDFGRYEDTWLPPELRWEYNPEKAKQLLAEAGYPDGFSITLTPSLRGAPVEVEACEAIATMWADIGLDVKFQSLPYSTLRPSLIARNYQGSTCHAGSIRLEPGQGYSGMLSQLHYSAVWNRGVEHPWLDEKVSAHMAEVDSVKRRELAIEIATFLFENAVTAVGLYNFDVVWPVGPKIQPWPEGVRYRDIRNINGYEFIQPR